MKNPFKQDNLNLKILVAIFVTYLWCLVWVVGLKFNSDWLYELREYMLKLPLESRVGNNWIPFYSLIKSVQEGTYKFNLDHLLNVVIYIPMGIYLYLFMFKKMKYSLVVIVSVAVFMVTSICFEVAQLYTGTGGCDGTDFACNFFGGCIIIHTHNFFDFKQAVLTFFKFSIINNYHATDRIFTRDVRNIICLYS